MVFSVVWTSENPKNYLNNTFCYGMSLIVNGFLFLFARPTNGIYLGIKLAYIPAPKHLKP